MFEKSFITDCEGPLTLNDNAFELAESFILKMVENYLKFSVCMMIICGYCQKGKLQGRQYIEVDFTFLCCENLKNKDLVDFSKNHIYSVSDSKFLLNYLQKAMNTYIVSTSYGQYIEAVSNYMDLPFENTFYTKGQSR